MHIGLAISAKLGQDEHAKNGGHAAGCDSLSFSDAALSSTVQSSTMQQGTNVPASDITNKRNVKHLIMKDKGKLWRGFITSECLYHCCNVIAAHFSHSIKCKASRMEER